MKKLLMFVWMGMFLLSACGATREEGTGVEAHDPWARTALKDGNGAAYLLLHNHSTEDDALVGVSSDMATATEIHLSQMKSDGTMEMVKQESIALPADGEVELKPGSYHIMLIGLKQDLKKGDEITLTLHFKNHEDITLTVPVLDAGDMGGSGMDGHIP
jgi:periplasmic copper chaperone A